jgi:phosphoglycerate dehydrogenase-like enzyme
MSERANGAKATIAVNLQNYGGIVDQVQAQFGEGEVVVAGDDERARDAEILAAFTHERDVLRASVTPSVRWIHAFSTGVDGFPFDLVGDRLFTCSRGASALPISEWVLAVMLARAKRLPESWITEPPEHWNRANLDLLSGATVGIVGLGAIGTEVARRALAFGMTVLGYRRTAAPAPIDGIDVVTSLPDLLARSDHVVVAAPATPATYHLLDADAFAAIKPGAHLVNIARGSLVDQDALIAALDDGRVAAASLDTVDPEPLPAGHPLYNHPKVRVSPHISWSAPSMLQTTLSIFVENVKRYRAGQPLEGVVDVEAGY